MMNKIVKFPDIPLNAIENKKKTDIINRIFEQSYSDLCLTDYYTEDDLEFLTDFYTNQNAIFNTGVISKDDVENFYNQLFSIIDQFKNSDMGMEKEDYADCILLYYNCYRIYGNKLFSLDLDRMELMMRMYMEADAIWDGEKRVSELDDWTKIIFLEDIYEKARRISDNKDEIVKCFEGIMESCYIDNNLTEGYIRYQANMDLDSLEETKNDFSQENLHIGIFTPEILCDKMAPQVSGMINFLMACGGNEGKDPNVVAEQCSYFQDNMDSLLYHLKTIEENRKDDVYRELRDVWNSEMGMNQKIEQIFSKVNEEMEHVAKK